LLPASSRDSPDSPPYFKVNGSLNTNHINSENSFAEIVEKENDIQRLKSLQSSIDEGLVVPKLNHKHSNEILVVNNKIEPYINDQSEYLMDYYYPAP